MAENAEYIFFIPGSIVVETKKSNICHHADSKDACAKLVKKYDYGTEKYYIRQKMNKFKNPWDGTNSKLSDWSWEPVNYETFVLYTNFLKMGSVRLYDKAERSHYGKKG